MAGFAGMKKSVMVLAVLVVIVLLQAQVAKSQAAAGNQCATSLGNLNVCAPSLLNNVAPPPECCNALSAVTHECVCNTIRIASQLPSRCQLPPVSCGTGN